MNTIDRLRSTSFLFLLALPVLLAPVPINAEEIDLETAIAMALESNLGLEDEMQNLMQKKLLADTWWNSFYPSISAQATTMRRNEEQEASGSASTSTPPVWNLFTSLDMHLDFNLKLVPGIRLIKLDYEAGRLSLMKARQKVERDVTKQFYKLILLREQIELTSQRITDKGRRYEQARINYENGLTDEYKLLSARVAWENEKPKLTDLQVEYQQGLLAFRNDLGVSFTQDLEPFGEIDPPALTLELQEITRELLVRQLDVQQLQSNARILDQQYFLTNADRAPVLRLGWSYDPSFNGDPWQDNLFDGDRWNQREGAITITITQPIDPWLPFSKFRNDLSGIRRQQEQNRIQQAQALNKAEIEVRSLIRGIQAAEETVAALESNIDLAQRAYELAEVGYNNGLRDILEVQDAEVELQSARFELLKQRKQIMDNLIDLKFALNTTIDEIAVH